ncbi:hypothetical protein [Scytonema sp. PRP1]|uniref:hypothetical protein n=1 Tax=Scytonema sp. PRP1 TaxID=3120513 RepID=UPI00300C5F83
MTNGKIRAWETLKITFSTYREKSGREKIHLTLCEYAAGHYAADLDDEKIHKWLEKVRQD